MTALSIIFWIIVGIVVIIYKGFREAAATTFTVILIIGFFIGVAIVLTHITDNMEDPTVITPWLIIGFFAFVLISQYSTDAHWGGILYLPLKEKKINKCVDERLLGLRQEFVNSGYYVDDAVLIFDKGKLIVETFAETTSEDLRGRRKISDGGCIMKTSILYNRDEDRPETIERIYKRFSRVQKSALYQCDNFTLCKIAGVEIDNLPLDKISRDELEKFRIDGLKREANFNEEKFQQLLAKEYSKDIGDLYSPMDRWCRNNERRMEIYKQKEQVHELLIKYILTKLGWDASYLAHSSCSPEYVKEFIDYMMTHGSNKLSLPSNVNRERDLFV